MGDRREEVGRKTEDGRENNVAAAGASNGRTLHTSPVQAQAEPGHGTPAFQERGPHPNTPATILHSTYMRKQQLLTSRGTSSRVHQQILLLVDLE